MEPDILILELLDSAERIGRRTKPSQIGKICCAWQRFLQESMNRWACPILPEGPTTPLGKSSTGSFAFLDVRYEKSENGLPGVPPVPRHNESAGKP